MMGTAGRGPTRSDPKRGDAHGQPYSVPQLVELPYLSVIVPVYNDPSGIGRTLESLTDQTLPQSVYEIVVVDNGSTDETKSVVSDYAAVNENLSLEVEDEVQGSYAARNRGIRASTGEVLAFVDADMSVDPDWLRHVVAEMERRDADYLACEVQLYPPGDEETLAGMYNRLTDLRVGHFLREMRFAPTCSLVVRRSLLEDVGGFDPRFRSSGDFEFGNRVHDAGRMLHYDPDVTMYHPERTTVTALLRKSYRIGRGKVELHRYYPDRYGHQLRRVLNPLAYLPPTPAHLRSAVTGWEELDTEEKVAFFLLAYGNRLAKAAGQLRELLASVRISPSGDTPSGQSTSQLETVEE